jgi:hypothetical protein
MPIVKLYNGEFKEENDWSTIYDTLGTRSHMGQLPSYRDNQFKYNEDGYYWEDRVASLTVQPGYELCGYDWKNKGGNWGEVCYTSDNSIMQKKHMDEIASMRLRLDCAYDAHKWNEECNKPNPNQDQYKGNCNINSTCYLNKVKECSNSNLTNNTNCKNFCTINPDKCTTSISNYCNNLDLDTLNNESVCNTLKTNIIKDKCTNDEKLFNSTTCKSYCTNKPNDCIDVSNRYCFNNMDKEECQTYCTKNINNCEMNIKKYCVNDNIKNTFCTSVLSSNEMGDKHDEVMEKYCNESPNKNDPLCNCKNKEAIFNNYKQLKADSLRDSLIARPDCFYGPCTRAGTYKISIGKPCPNLTICQNNIESLNISNSCNGELTTNCIKIENNCTTNTNADTGASIGAGTNASASAGAGAGTNESTNDGVDNNSSNSESSDDNNTDTLNNNILESISTKLNVFNLPKEQNMYLQLSTIIICCCCCCCLLLMMFTFKKK